MAAGEFLYVFSVRGKVTTLGPYKTWAEAQSRFWELYGRYPVGEEYWGKRNYQLTTKD